MNDFHKYVEVLHYVRYAPQLRPTNDHLLLGRAQGSPYAILF